jgi:uncharacterized membrane protein YjfL (UPF0719 family)
MKILVAFGIVSSIPVFSDTYLYNKLSWYPFVVVIFAFVYLYFSPSKRKALIQKLNVAENFYSGRAILLLLIVLALPILGIVHL